jgi:hypothetical protein
VSKTRKEGNLKRREPGERESWKKGIRKEMD